LQLADRSGSTRDRHCRTAVHRFCAAMQSPKLMRWFVWWRRASPSRRTWGARLADRCAPCAGHQTRYTEGGMTGREEGWRRGRRRISGKRLRNIRASARMRFASSQTFKARRNRAASVCRDHDWGSGAAAGNWRTSAKSMGDDPDRAAPPADDLADTNLLSVRYRERSSLWS
jgi:hypothetical protein